MIIEHHDRIARLTVSAGIALLLALATLLRAQQAEPEKREQIGEVLGQPVYRDQLRGKRGSALRGEVLSLFAEPVMRKYRAAHQAEIKPTNDELDRTTAYLQEQFRKEEEPRLQQELKEVVDRLAGTELSQAERATLERRRARLKSDLQPPDQSLARFLLDNWKFQRHLYDKYGGGRVLWQQAGMEAFDAMHAWLETHEKQGDFKIADPALRTSFYYYWTTMEHGSFLISDKESIRAEFLEPKWARTMPSGK